ncbi:MAG: hypothetical protein ACRDVE_14270 [Actinocrinis sp.]
MDLAAVFTAMPNAAPLAGLSEAWHWAEVPGFDFTAALSSDGRHVFEFFALRSYDEGLAVSVLAFARQHESELIAVPDRPLVLAEGFAYPGRGFDMVAAIGPGVHENHDEDGPLHAVTRVVFPVYRCEFSGIENEEEARYRYSRAAGATPSRLGRQPRPTMKIRYRPDDGSVMAERDYFTPNSLQYQFPKLENRPDRFLEFENFQNRVWRVEWDGAFNVSELTGDGGEHRGLSLEESLEFAKTVLYGPNLDAGTTAFTKRH